jgi:arabinofuranan 3-O-arabinosyltransferase
MRDFLGSAAKAFREARRLTRERLLLAGAACGVGWIGVLALAGFFDAGGEHWGRDFVQFWTYAQLAAGGRPAAAYALHAHQTIDHVFAYPPIVMLLCRPLAGLSYPAAVLVWGVLGLALFAFTLSRLVGWEIAALAAVVTPSAVFNIYLQQTGYYTAVLLGGGLMLLERRPTAAGIVLGMLWCKPQLGILLLPALIAGRYWQTLVAVALTALTLTTASAILYGPDAWIGYFSHMVALSRLIASADVAATWMPMTTVFAMMRHIGASVPAAYTIQGLSTICAAVAVALLWRGDGSLAIKSAGLVIATFLATSYAWAYDAVVLTLAAAWLANEAAKTGFRPWEKTCVLVLLTLPALAAISVRLSGLQIGPILLWLALVVVMQRGLDWRFPVVIQPARSLSSGSTSTR